MYIFTVYSMYCMYLKDFHCTVKLKKMVLSQYQNIIKNSDVIKKLKNSQQIMTAKTNANASLHSCQLTIQSH